MNAKVKFSGRGFGLARRPCGFSGLSKERFMRGFHRLWPALILSFLVVLTRSARGELSFEVLHGSATPATGETAKGRYLTEGRVA